jgi:hypothetical protein
MAVSYFTTKTWKFRNDKLLGLMTHVLPCDKKDFYLDNLENLDHKAILLDGISGARKYLLKEHPDTFSDAKRHYRR